MIPRHLNQCLVLLAAMLIVGCERQQASRHSTAALLADPGHLNLLAEQCAITHHARKLGETLCNNVAAAIKQQGEKHTPQN